MPEADAYTFTHKELVALLIRRAGVSEGKWMLQVNFGFTAGNFGANEEDVSPGGIMLINKVGITRAKEGAPGSLVVDASEVNSPATS